MGKGAELSMCPLPYLGIWDEALVGRLQKRRLRSYTGQTTTELSVVVGQILTTASRGWVCAVDAAAHDELTMSVTVLVVLKNI